MSKEAEKIEVTPENEMDLIQNLIKAADYKNEVRKRIEIKRGNETPIFTFEIMPLSMDEILSARKNATTFMPNPNNPKLPHIAKEISEAEYYAWQIYLATVPDVSGKKIWDNPNLKNGLNTKGIEVLTGADVIKAVFTAGELEKVSDAIDDISGENESLVDYAKN